MHQLYQLLFSGIRLNPWRVYGMFLPDTIKCVTIGGADYILTANEGDAKEYEMDTHGVEWSEEKQGKQFSTGNYHGSLVCIIQKNKFGILNFT